MHFSHVKIMAVKRLEIKVWSDNWKTSMKFRAKNWKPRITQTTMAVKITSWEPNFPRIIPCIMLALQRQLKSVSRSLHMICYCGFSYLVLSLFYSYIWECYLYHSKWTCLSDISQKELRQQRIYVY